MEKKATQIKRSFNGIVVSDKMNKTIVVNIEIGKTHPTYKKKYTSSKNYKVHDEKNEAKVGDRVTFVEVRPISKDKRWMLTSINK